MTHQKCCSKSKKRLLPMANACGNDIIMNDTCFAAHARYGVLCMRKKCRNWITNEKNFNCAMIAAQRGPMTLQDIGSVFGLTRMRICQIEKKIRGKIMLPIMEEMGSISEK